MTPTGTPTATPTDTPTPTETPTSTPTPTPLNLDDFQCYKGRTSRGAPKFAPAARVSTSCDRFSLIGSPTGFLTVDVKKQNGLCAPASVNGANPSAPTDVEHEVGYQMKISPNTAPFTRVVNQPVVTGEFGMLTLDVLKPTQLLLRSAKSLVSTPPPLVSPITDQFSCYKVRISRGTPKFVAVPGTTVADQFGTPTMTVKKPQQLCAPANVNGQQPGAEHHAGLLLCFKLQRPPTTPKFTLASVFVNDDFGPLNVDAQKYNQVCVLAQIHDAFTP